MSPKTPTSTQSSRESIIIKGARQNNLKNLDLELPINELTVVTGVSGSGKSTLAFDTIYAEGQRRYIETFSAYARQFLDRMDKPAVDSIQGIPPAIAIGQSNPVRTSRSTVGTMTELNDYIKLLFARLSHLYCHQCDEPVTSDSAQSIVNAVLKAFPVGQRCMVCLPIEVPHNFTDEEVVQLLNQQGYIRIHKRDESKLEVVQDRIVIRDSAETESRLTEAVESALQNGGGHVIVYPLDEDKKAGQGLHFSSHHHCATCDITYSEPSPSLFSFNSPIGACSACKGFGRIVGVDYGLVIPDDSRSLAEGAVKPFQTPSNKEIQAYLLKSAKKSKIPTDKPWKNLTKKQQSWVIEGEGSWDDGLWFGIAGFFRWLEARAYKMHVRVLLSKYRSYTTCPDCNGARLKPEALWWYLDAEGKCTSGSHELRSRLNVHQLMQLPLEQCALFFNTIRLPKHFDEAGNILLTEVQSRLNYLLEVGLNYLTLDRQTRTLSGGEVQRINLTTALGTSLVNTLFVLDEPSIGLHPRDINRLVKVLHRLRDAGNTLLVVEHDPQVILAADRVLDIGPGPGKQGGEITFFGTPKTLMKSRKSLTADYLTGRKQVVASSRVGGAEEYALGARKLEIVGVSEHNLKNIDVTIPLQALVCITGVSGSGKSTLMRDVLYPALCRKKGVTCDMPGAHVKLTGHQHIDDVVLVDQSPIGKTTRSIPATYVGAFDTIRKLFVATPLAKERAYTTGTFSFNSGNGRCPTCSGNGFEQVEMQFLSDVYLRCTDCDGSRYREEILEVKLISSQGEGSSAKSIADILSMTVAEALNFFADEASVVNSLKPLSDVGLQYVQLGQAVPTLSGGEAQRLKLAGHLAKNALSKAKAERLAKSKRAQPLKSEPRGTLFLFDEPTTGLHFDDIATLMQAFQQLLDAGHSLLVIEHNLDVICSSDWVIDIGPEGGNGGGELVGEGQPAEFIRTFTTHTAMAMKAYAKGSGILGCGTTIGSSVSAGHVAESPAPYAVVEAQTKRPKSKSRCIKIHNAREHNLKNIDIDIPLDKFTVITGVSGSGKSTVAFDLIFGEGQRRYLESLNAYARQFIQSAPHPDVDAIHGIPPTVAIEQRTSRGGRKSTVATLTEIYHFMRLLFVKLGTQYCPDCDEAIEPQSPEAILARIQKTLKNKEIRLLAPMVVARKGIYNELAKWAFEKGYEELRVDGKYLATDPWPKLDRYKEHDIELPVATIKVSPKNEAELLAALTRALDVSDGVVVVSEQGKTKSSRGKDTLFSTKRSCPCCGQGFDELDPRQFSYNSKHGWCEDCFGTGLLIKGFDQEQTGEEGEWVTDEDETEVHCYHCDGQRLNPSSLAVRFKNKSIAQLAALPVDKAEVWFEKIKYSNKETVIVRDLMVELNNRLKFLNKVGLGYLTLDRAAPTLSGGEAQRIRLASQLGSNLQGVCYILDEPTIGLHARDNKRLIGMLRELQQQGNTVLVVEHDEDTINEADYIIDMGPGAGVNGGEVVAHGTLAKLKKNKNSITGQFIANPLRHPMAGCRDIERRKSHPKEKLTIRGARENNLDGLTVDIPLRQLVCVSGVSGSGKSTLIRSVLQSNLRPITNAPGKAANKIQKANKKKWTACDGIDGWESIRRILEVDQTPIGKTTRSCPVTYIGVWDQIRKLFAGTVDARLRGYTPARFSFNTGDGRCDGCGGHGMRKVEMNFLPDVRVACEQCNGWRFNSETLSVRYKGKHIGEVLMMNIDEAADYFESIPSVHHTLELLQDVGLGYLTLGQQSPTLSGGEAQRIKLVAELAKAKVNIKAIGQHSLYILDEPTVGLHMADVERLVRVLHRLVDAGNSVIVIEHNLDVIAEADWVIDMGPEGGSGGGKIVAQGAPATICKRKKSHTGHYLKELIG